MRHDDEFPCLRELVLRQYPGEVVYRSVQRDEFCSLLLSRRPLERCDDEPAHCRGLFDRATGELFDILERDLYSRA